MFDLLVQRYSRVLELMAQKADTISTLELALLQIVLKVQQPPLKPSL